MAVTNTGQKATNALLTLHYDNGEKNYELQQTIAPGDQMWINLTQPIRNRVADRNGNSLPVDLKTGTYELRDLSPGVGHLHVDGVALDDTFGFSAVPPPCPSCCPLVSIAFDSGFLDLPFGTTDPVGIVGINQCTGGSEALTPDFTTWGSDNVGIAKASYAKVQATGPGSTTVYAGGYVNGPGECECSPVFQQPTLPVTVTPTISSIIPAQGAVGAAIGVTITGTGFASGATVNAGSNIAVSNVSVSSSTQITATFTPTNSSAAGGNQAVTVTVAGQTSNSQNFFNQVPTHFQRFDQPPEAPGGLGPVTTVTNGNVVDLLGNILRTGFCGVYENFLFDVADQQSNEIGNGTVTVTEVFSNIKNPPGPTPATVSVLLGSQGVTDNQAYGFNYPTCLTKNQNQALDMTWTVKVGTVVYPVTTSVHITKGNFNGTQNVTSNITTP